jgi:hypothetical protein
MAAASPLPTDARSAFFEAVTVRLTTVPELGDGVVSRTCRETVRQFFDPPDLNGKFERRG